NPENLKHHTLLHLDQREEWRDWLDAAGINGVELSKGAVFNQTSLALDAAAVGQGVALGRSALAAPDLLAGRLVRPFEFSLPVAYAYYIVCPKPTAERPKIKAFREWLVSEAKADETGMKALGIFAPVSQ
ncbi:MAG: transcriptional regulator, partial [Rhodospirillaceae bacterium]|nr:transcriptional regulator [Rhodospirillaceae bacterium]